MPQAKELDITNACVSAFSFEGADVRVFSRSDEPWWVLADVCKILEIRNSSDAANRLDEDERSTIAITDSGNLNAERTIINESGLYSLILTSRKPAAKRFKKWVTAEVLPAIRKTGSYNVAPRARRPSVLRAFNTAMKIGDSTYSSSESRMSNALIPASTTTRRASDSDLNFCAKRNSSIAAAIFAVRFTCFRIGAVTGLGMENPIA